MFIARAFLKILDGLFKTICVLIMLAVLGTGYGFLGIDFITSMEGFDEVFPTEDEKYSAILLAFLGFGAFCLLAVIAITVVVLIPVAIFHVWRNAKPSITFPGVDFLSAIFNPRKDTI